MAEVESEIVPPSGSFRSDLDFTVHDWNKKFDCKTLNSNDFKVFWARNVPVIYSPTPGCDCLNLTYNEEAAERILYTPLEWFICGSKESEKAFEHLKNSDDPRTLCGKVFKTGEPTYSCRDCGLDPTCVLCVDCFRNSAHKNHRYKMSTSGGGGYCDCGDEEAWKTHPFCDIHHKGKSQDSETSSSLDKLPPDVVERLKLVMQVVLQYCYQMLTWEHAINLPRDLQSPSHLESEVVDAHATVLFNDEIHTYEEVIETLGKAISCTKKEAIDYATTIDREGRSIVKCSTFASCNQVRNIIERITSRQGRRPLKVVVMRTEVIAHQTFAMRLLSWLQKILACNEGFRLVFSQVLMESPGSDSTLLESVMLSDTQLWKTARNQWHQLFISGMLMDQQCKKIFAKVFTKNYPVLMKEFIADDHDHSISVTSLSVQIFTVPTLAHALIQEEDAISVLLRTFLTECERNRNEDGKLAFQRNQINSSFRRAQYMIYDLKYLLTVKPIEWNDALRKNFLHGIQSLLTLLSWMQGMDSVVRQVGQHVEFEAEWETGINFQLKLAPVVTLALEWCGSDSAVFIRTFRGVLRNFQSPQVKMICVGVELADHSASCIDFDVSSMPVTIHLPLSRFIAGLFLHLGKFGLFYECPEFLVKSKPGPEQLMELPLRTLVMLAQFRAGMWRRNGYSLLNQVYFYHNVRLRDEMFDRDIMMMQIAASMIESNEFLIHLIYKYGLRNWVEEIYDGTYRKAEDDNTRQTLTVAEEFLGLVLTVVSERFTPGIGNVSEAERIKKEIMQLLCIEPMPHSQLFKMLPKDPNNETGMEEVVNEVADFKKPQGSGTGKYELKPEFYKCFNPFYYHYTREEQSRAEEGQLKRKKQSCEELCCPPPVPPEFCPRFCMITNVLQCDAMLHVIHLILQRTLNLHSSAFSETQFEKVLHLIGVALHEEQRTLESYGENSFFCFTEKAIKKGIISALEECLKSPRIESQKDLLRWVLAKFRSVQSSRAKGKNENSSVDISATECQVGESSAQDRKIKAELAAARRARIMAQMSAMQKNFIKEHAEQFKEAVLEESSNLSGSQLDIYVEFFTDDPVSVGSQQRGRTVSSKIYTCILCREDQEVTSSGRALVLAAFVQRSSVLSKNRKRQLTNPESYDAMLLPSDLFCGPHTSTCGHVMHSDCWQKFFESVLMKEQRRPVRFGRHTSFEVDKNEFLCPLCERLSNGVIPLIPALTTLIPENSLKLAEIAVDDWLTGMKKAVEKYQTEKLKDPSSDTEKGEKFLYYYRPTPLNEVAEALTPEISNQFLTLFSCYRQHASEEENNTFSVSLMDMMKLFSQTTYTVGLNVDPNAVDVRVPVMAWWSCAYTIHAIEWLLREQNKALFGKLSSRNAHCLEAIIRFCSTSLLIFDKDVVRTHCVRMLRYLLLGEHYLSSPQCCLELDAFSVLVFLVLSMPVLFENKDLEDEVPMMYPLGTTLDGHVLYLLFMFHLVQLLLTYPFNEEDAMETDIVEDVSEDSEEVVATHFYKEVRTAAGFNQHKPMPSGHLIVHLIKTGSLPFLRCCALFFHFVTDTAVPQVLQELDDQEFEHLCKFLGLPTAINEFLTSSSLKQLALSWARHPRTLHLLLIPTLPTDAVMQTTGEQGDDYVESLIRHPLSVNQLVSLPSDYSELINSVSLFTCPNSDGDDSRNPTMCLVCGVVLCSQSYCCQTELEGTMVGACTQHAHFCGAGIGIFLRIRDCKILLLAGKSKGCFMAPPYVDDYGETDQGLCRGNPLHLCQEKYQELHQLWLGHGIPEQVSHVMEQSTSLPNWQLL